MSKAQQKCRISLSFAKSWKIFYNSSIFKVVSEHVETKELSNRWYEELNYAKLLPEPYADPMDLIILSNAFDMIYKPKYKKSVDLSH